MYYKIQEKADDHLKIFKDSPDGIDFFKKTSSIVRENFASLHTKQISDRLLPIKCHWCISHNVSLPLEYKPCKLQGTQYKKQPTTLKWQLPRKTNLDGSVSVARYQPWNSDYNKSSLETLIFPQKQKKRSKTNWTWTVVFLKTTNIFY